MGHVQHPDVATLRTMARTLSVFYLFGGATGLLVALGAGAAGVGREVVVAASVVALIAGGVTGRYASRWARWAFHLPLVAGAGLVMTAVVFTPDPAAAAVLAALMSFIVIDACFFFRTSVAVLYLVACPAAATAALLVRDDVTLPIALGLDVVLVAVGTVTRGLVNSASHASRDPLTGLSNRRGLDDALHELLATLPRTGAPLSAALLDLDHFKSINDTQGHDAGDRVLRQVADAWRKALPPRAVLARHGGDEFALLLPGLDGPATLDLTRLLCALHPEIRVSCGVAEYVAHDSAAQLMRRADRALYVAKAAGRGRCELASAQV